MSFIADRLKSAKTSPTMAITKKARDLAADGLDIVSLSAGEPDFDTPAHIVAAGKKALDDGMTRYTDPNGIPELRDAIRAKFERENGLTYARDEIHVSGGGKSIIFNALMATVNPGDEVIIVAPYWVSYPDMVRIFGGVPVIVDCPLDSDFKITPAQLEAAITPKTKWLIMNSPSNPTGSAYSEAELRGLCDVLLRHPQVWTLTDDIYEHIVFDDFKFKTVAQVEPELKARTLTMNGMSKAYCMTGWRVGFGGAPAELVKAMTNVQSQSLTCIAHMAQVASVVALNGPKDFIEEHRQAFQDRRDLVVGMLNQASGITCSTPEGAFYVYPSIEGTLGRTTPDGKVIGNDEDFVTALLEAEGVAAVHGAAFGISPHFRISYATSNEILTKACERIQRFCGSLR